MIISYYMQLLPPGLLVAAVPQMCNFRVSYTPVAVVLFIHVVLIVVGSGGGPTTWSRLLVGGCWNPAARHRQSERLSLV